MGRDVRVLVTALLLVLGATISAPVLLFGGLIAYRMGSVYLARTDFDAVAWREAAGADAGGEEAVRIHMIDDLLSRHVLEGMTRAEVAALLGEPDDSSREASDPGRWDLVYHLGPERGLIPMDWEHLALRLGEDGRVSEVRIIVS